MSIVDEAVILSALSEVDGSERRESKDLHLLSRRS
jgi:hypothetical protein